jgi:hypothetical protein
VLTSGLDPTWQIRRASTLDRSARVDEGFSSAKSCLRFVPNRKGYMECAEDITSFTYFNDEFDDAPIWEPIV